MDRETLRGQFWQQHRLGLQGEKQATFMRMLPIIQQEIETHLRNNLQVPKLPIMPRGLDNFQTCYWYLELQYSSLIAVRVLRSMELESKLSLMNLNGTSTITLDYGSLIQEHTESSIKYGRKAASLARFL